MIITSVINTALGRILFGKLAHISSNYPVYSGKIEVCIKSGHHVYFEYFDSEDFVFAFNFDRDNYVIFNNYTKLIYQKGKNFDIAKYLNYAKRFVNKSINLLISNKMTLSIELDINGNNYLRHKFTDSSFSIKPEHKENLIKRFRGISWWTYDIVIAIKDDKIYILILNK